MNKAVFALVLVGLVVLATTVEARYASKDKMRMKKARSMAKKERTSIDKLKAIKMREGVKPRTMEAPAEDKRRGRDDISRAYAALKQELVAKDITLAEFKERASNIKRDMTNGQTRQKEARKDKARNKRSVKKTQEAMKKRRATLQNTNKVAKLRRGEK